MLLPLAAPLFGQVDLNRISAVERSDGMGYVVRYHLEAPLDSFRLRQPSPDRIQVALYADRLDTTGLRLPSPGDVIREIRLQKIEGGFGADVRLADGKWFAPRVYPDSNRRDLLLSLTRTEAEEVGRRVRNTEPFAWAETEPGPDAESSAVAADEFLYDEGYMQIHENLNFDTVVIDAGHGGRDPGTIGHGGIREKNITLAVAKKLGGYIEEHMPGVRVVYTREEDRFLELQERGRIANRARGDLFVSIHANSYPRNPRVRGAEIYFLGLARTQSALEVMKRENSVVRLENGNGMDELTEEDLIIYELANAGNLAISERIAEKMEYQLRERARRHSRGVKQAQFVVLYHASMPALLVELGFITNPDEARFLNSDYGQAIVASALFRAIRDYKNEYERSRNLTRSE